jgi:hypothetical protein
MNNPIASIELFHKLNNIRLSSITWLEICSIARIARECNHLKWLCVNYPTIPWIKAIKNNNSYISNELKGGE